MHNYFCKRKMIIAKCMIDKNLFWKKAKPEKYAIVSVFRCTFLNSENGTQGESHTFMQIGMHLLNLCVNQFLLYNDASEAVTVQKLSVQVAGLWKVAREANFEPEELESLRQELVSLWHSLPAL